MLRVVSNSPYTPISTNGDEQGEDRNVSGVLSVGDALGPDDVSPVRMFVTTPAVNARGCGSPTTILSVKRGAVAYDSGKPCISRLRRRKVMNCGLRARFC